MKNSNDTIGDRTRDLPACSAVPQPNAPPRAMHRRTTLVNFQLDAQNSYLFIYNTFIKLLYMLRALPCSSSGGLRRKCSFLTGAQDSHLQRVTIPEAAYI